MNILSNKTPFFDQLIADITPKHKVVRITTENAVMRFRVITDLLGLQSLKKQAQDFARMCEKRMEPPEFSHLLPCDTETASKVALLAALSLDELTVWNMLQIAQTNPLFFDTLCGAIDQATSIQSRVEIGEEVDAAKNDSGETLPGEIAS